MFLKSKPEVYSVEDTGPPLFSQTPFGACMQLDPTNFVPGTPSRLHWLPRPLAPQFGLSGTDPLSWVGYTDLACLLLARHRPLPQFPRKKLEPARPELSPCASATVLRKHNSPGGGDWRAQARPRREVGESARTAPASAAVPSQLLPVETA